MPAPERPALRRAGKGGASLGAVALAVLVPKCPLCVAGLLSAAGFATAGARSVAPYVRPGAFALAAAIALLVVGSELRRRRTRSAACCASRGGAGAGSATP